ncbi:MAG: UDP-N-acetylglucosamine 2-epimerase (non-hydrolyzing) [bacterium]|nr:UDP-N-acetylglucosamine 2-epimerase (non-hydrolyzing) [bacterium]
MTKKIILAFGTRPEAIKMAPLVLKLKANKKFNIKVVLTAQHRKMLDQVMKLFEIGADYDLDIMTPSQTLYHTTTRVLNGVGEILRKENPDLLLVHGDTTTTFAASLAAFYERIPVGHVESGLRSFDKQNPFPEEVNRVLTDAIANLYFAPTVLAKQNILQENIDPQKVFITGNTVTDALLHVAGKNYDINLPDNFILATVHRRENFGEPLRNICAAFNEITEKTNLKIILPVHPNPNVKNIIYKLLGSNKNIILSEPFEYLELVQIMKKTKMVITDSGGLQEEAPSLGKPVLVMRKTTERPEAIKYGTAKLVGTTKNKIVDSVYELWSDNIKYSEMANAINPYGDGKACERISQVIEYFFKIEKKYPEEFSI